MEQTNQRWMSIPKQETGLYQANISRETLDLVNAYKNYTNETFPEITEKALKGFLSNHEDKLNEYIDQLRTNLGGL